MVFNALSLLFATLFISALATPLLYSALLTQFPEFPWPYSRVFDRVAMLVALLLLIVMKERFNLGPLKEFLNERKRWRKIALGVALALATSIASLPFLVWLGDLNWEIRSLEYYLSRIPKVLVGALLIAFIEECFFRGILLQSLLRKYRPGLAIFLISLIYAAVHFIAPVKAWIYPGYSISVGFSYLGALVQQGFNIELLAPLIGLFLVGVTLGSTICRHYSLYLCIGLHAGWIAVVKGVFYLTTINPQTSELLSPLARRYFLVSTMAAWISIGLVAIIILMLKPLNREAPGIANHRSEKLN